MRTNTKPTQLFVAAGAQLVAHTQPALRTGPMAPAWRLPLVSRRINLDLTRYTFAPNSNCTYVVQPQMTQKPVLRGEVGLRAWHLYGQMRGRILASPCFVARQLPPRNWLLCYLGLCYVARALRAAIAGRHWRGHVVKRHVVAQRSAGMIAE